jgi:FkbM family methyltransferase
MSTVKLVELDEGLSMYVSSTLDAGFIYAEIFREGCYNFVRLPDRALVIDVGAHVGLFALYIKRRHPDARVIAFEPSPETAGVLRRNIELHGLADVTVHELALGSRPEREVPFTYYPIAPGNSTRYPHEKELQKSVMARTLPAKLVERVHTGREISIAVERLSTYLSAGEPVDLLKVDVEGAELEVLLGIDPPQWPLIGQALLEVQDLDGRLAAVCDLLRGHGLEPKASLAPMADPDVRNYMVHAVRP